MVRFEHVAASRTDDCSGRRRLNLERTAAAVAASAREDLAMEQALSPRPHPIARTLRARIASRRRLGPVAADGPRAHFACVGSRWPAAAAPSVALESTCPRSTGPPAPASGIHLLLSSYLPRIPYNYCFFLDFHKIRFLE